MGAEVRPVVRAIQGSYLHIELVGSDVGATWGRSGQALDALQFLANMILSRNRGSDVRLMLDADDYRARRAEALSIRAIELAREVKARNEEAELEPLPAHERRIIHSALADDPDISTYSEGDEPGRHVVISPRR
jgi:spoIIIJ-associated protein